jgi:hypothetical protein
MPTLQHATSFSLLCCAAVLAGCAKKDNAAVDTSAVVTTTSDAMPAVPAPINLADVAGKWNMKSVPASGDTTPTTYVLTATDNTNGWSLAFPGRAQPVPLTIRVDGDSIQTTSAQYSSVRRKGLKVTTVGWWHLQNGTLSGSTTAHYVVKTPDSVMVLHSTGTRAP